MPAPLPASGVAIRRAVVTAVAAAGAHDGPGLAAAVALLAAADDGQVRGVLHELVLRLVEQAHPDGLDADDARALLDRVTAYAAGGPGEVDAYAVALVLGGALAVHEDDAPPAPVPSLLTAAVLTVERLLAALALPLGPELDAAFAELRRAQTMELP